MCNTFHISGRESYQALLHSIKYGADTLQVSGKDTSANFGGVMFDSGTSFTYLVPDAYAVVLDAVSFYLCCPSSSEIMCFDEGNTGLTRLLCSWRAGGEAGKKEWSCKDHVRQYVTLLLAWSISLPVSYLKSCTIQFR